MCIVPGAAVLSNVSMPPAPCGNSAMPGVGSSVPRRRCIDRQAKFAAFCPADMAISLFRAIGGLARNIVVANALGSMMLFLVILMGGFVLVKPNIHPWT